MRSAYSYTVLLLSLLVVLSCNKGSATSTAAAAPNTSPQTASRPQERELKDNAKATVTYVDVRTVQEFQTGHIPNALNLPLQALSNRLDELREIDHQIVLYCRSGNRSGQAKRLLEGEGFSNLVNGGGVEALAKSLGVELAE